MKESLGEKYINQIIEDKAKESNQKAIKNSSWKVIEEALFWMDLKDLPTPQFSLDNLHDNSQKEDDNYDDDSPMLDNYYHNLGV